MRNLKVSSFWAVLPSALFAVGEAALGQVPIELTVEGQTTVVENSSADYTATTATAVKEMESMPGLALTALWQTNGAPADTTGTEDAADRPVVLEPPANGTIFRIVEFPPDSAWRGRADAADAFDSIGAADAPVAGSDDPMMHKTATVDYLMVLKGEIWAILDDSEVCLKPGDVMIQRGTNHS